MPRPLRRTIALPAIAALLGAGAMAGCSAFQDDEVVLYGDSLADEAGPSFRSALGGGYDVRLSGVPGAAPCNLFELVERDLRGTPPDVAVIEFSGNNGTECMLDDRGRPLTGDALLERYASDVHRLARDLAGAGTSVVLAGAPRAEANDTAARLAVMYRLIADDLSSQGLPVRFADTAAPVLGEDGSFQRSLPCRPDDPPQPPCADGEVVVRADDGVHFSAVGAARFGRSMAEAVREA